MPPLTKPVPGSPIANSNVASVPAHRVGFPVNPVRPFGVPGLTSNFVPQVTPSVAAPKNRFQTGVFNPKISAATPKFANPYTSPASTFRPTGNPYAPKGIDSIAASARQFVQTPVLQTTSTVRSQPVQTEFVSTAISATKPVSNSVTLTTVIPAATAATTSIAYDISPRLAQGAIIAFSPALSSAPKTEGKQPSVKQTAQSNSPRVAQKPAAPAQAQVTRLAELRGARAASALVGQNFAWSLVAGGASARASRVIAAVLNTPRVTTNTAASSVVSSGTPVSTQKVQIETLRGTLVSKQGQPATNPAQKSNLTAAQQIVNAVPTIQTIQAPQVHIVRKSYDAMAQLFASLFGMSAVRKEDILAERARVRREIERAKELERMAQMVTAINQREAGVPA